VKSLEDVEKLVKWPFLGCVPIIDLKANITEFEKDLLTHLKPKDPTAEAYRAIRTSVFFSSTEERPLRSMLVTSPGPKEGKTTTVCNLVIVIGQFDRKVLIVDADMRMPRLHEVFKKKNEKGLSDFLCGQAKLEDIVQKTDIENIFIISGGSYPPNPSELLSSHKMKQFIEAAKKKYDFILFDTPPAAVVTDAVVLSKAADGVIMVVESGKTSRRALPRVSKVLDDAKARIVGTLLNKVPIKSSSYHYYYYTQYYGKTR
ncbi:MAG: CpsD/CapB family tyrosine-protein kinase, partial [Candidatus Omnitrophica bacterium]|nr:CpsD/CapB family tyrosine-protein kinase [Candidatus Omnitrophota bacterium]